MTKAKMRRACAGIAVAGAAVAGCSSSGRTATGNSATAPQAPATSAAASTGPGGIPVTQTVHQGQSFEMSYMENGVLAKWRVALASIKCGGSKIFDRTVLAAYYSGMGEPVTVPQPGPGQQFCLARFSVTNAGQSNQPWSADEGTVNVGMNAYSTQVGGPGYDAEQAYLGYAQQNGAADSGLNPEVQGVSWGVWEIPAKDQPTSVSVADGTGNEPLDAEQVLVLLS